MVAVERRGLGRIWRRCWRFFSSRRSSLALNFLVDLTTFQVANVIYYLFLVFKTEAEGHKDFDRHFHFYFILWLRCDVVLIQIYKL